MHKLPIKPKPVVTRYDLFVKHGPIPKLVFIFIDTLPDIFRGMAVLVGGCGMAFGSLYWVLTVWK